MAESSPWSFSLTREEILARRTKRAEIAGELEKLQHQLAEEDRWYEAVKLIVPPHLLLGVEEAINGAQEGPEKVSIWRQAVSEALGAATHGMLPREIAASIKEQGSYEAKERIVRNPNGLYNALSRMLSDGQVFKHGDKFYRLGLYQELIHKGELDEDADERSTLGVGAFILSFIGEWDSLLPREIIAKLRESDEYAERIEQNPQYGYSAIARLVRQGRLVKDGAYYRLPHKENEPHDGGTSHGSDADSVGARSGVFG